ncbi:alpha/beta hydrolase [Ferrovibrio sp.]|uniref:alpha/beta fold hydrolase n=1 Tax=Ferrovibrio sp. TaxID=1917215 RepID=UPI0025C6C7D7|nr:alpha/beta hydrolase [Ferrovibrio sp.]MBX3455509.1 alpha/beta hydrolase [Ferrovibrio sp.]
MFVKYAEINGARTRYYDAGPEQSALPPVILLHGVGSSSDTWIYTVQALEKQQRVIAMDLPGHGFSATVPYEGAPQAHMLDQIIGLIDHLGFQRFSIAGSSYGAMMALLVYFRLKSRVERIVLLSSATATIPDEQRLESLKKAFNSSIDAYRAPTIETVIGRMKNLFHNADRIPRELALLQLNIFSQPGMRDNFEKLMRNLMNLEAVKPFAVDGRFGEIEAPMLMLWGLNDKQVDVPLARKLAAQAKNAYFIGIEESGHIPHLEQAEKTNGHMAGFLAGGDFSKYKAA